MSDGPTHPSIQAEVSRATRSARIRMVLSLGVLVALVWALSEQRRVVSWSQAFVRTTLPRLLQEAD